MKFSELFKQASKFAADNSPAILTGIGATGTLMTAYLTGKASFKAAEMIQDEYDNRIGEAGGINGDWEPPDFKEKVQLTWKLYIPAAGVAVATITAIIYANRIGMRRAAAMAAAYSFSEKALDEYKKKVAEKIGEKRKQGIDEEISQDRVSQNPVGGRPIIVTGNGNHLCYDELSGRHFFSNVQAIREAVNIVNHQVNNCNYASLTDFYNHIGLPPNGMSDDVGWNTDKLLDVTIHATMADNDEPCLSVGFTAAPIRGYHRVF